MINLNNLKTGKRLALGFGAMAALLLLLAASSWREAASMNLGMDTALGQSAKMSKIKDINIIVNGIYQEMWGLVTTKDAAAKQTHMASIQQKRDDYKMKVEDLKVLAKHQQDKDLLARLEEAMVGSRSLNQRIADMAVKSDGMNPAALELFSTEGDKVMIEKLEPAIKSLISYREMRVREEDAAAEAAFLRARWVLGAGALAALGLAAFLGFATTRSVIVPVKGCVEFTTLLARGDFSKELPELFRQRGDEMGDMARALHSLVDNTRKLLREVSGGVETLASSATELSAVSSQTSDGVKSMSDKTATVAAAAEEASANTTSVAAGMEQASANLASVAGATEEMSATVGEIAANSEKARAISEQATAQAQSVSALMRQLGQAALEIGKVTETITDISSQTNLLALNATIEAARAGASGKGFAVVANEIKELARQTASATEDIKAKIDGVQAAAGGAIADIEKISGVIGEVGSIVSSIAASIEEQAVVTKDVAGNIAQASSGMKDSNERVAQTASVSQSMARDIAGISAEVNDIRQGGEQVEASATELSKLAEQLKASVGRFKVDRQTVGSDSGARLDASSGASHRASSPGESKTEDVLIVWKNDYSVGVVTMDAHHQKLIALINRLYAALKRREGKLATQAILKQVIAYTQYHFKAEEELMAKIKYRDLAAQKKAHADFLSVVAAARDRWATGDESVPQALLATLQEWLIKHITVMDKQYEADFNKIK